MTMTDRLGELTRTGDGWEVRFERRLPQRPDRVWQALTDPGDLAAWFPTTIDFPAGDAAPQPGAPLTFRFRSGEAPDFTGSLITYEPPAVLAFWWGDDRVRIELTAEDGGTRLVLTDTMPEQGKAARDAAGWHTCLDALIRALAPGSSPADAPRAAWQPVHARYREAFGPAASTVGPPEG